MKAAGVVLGVAASVVLAIALLGYAGAGTPSIAAQQGATVQAPAEEQVPVRDVVIVWCAGTPDAPPLPAPEAGPVDAVTQATAEAGNIKQIAEKLGKELEAKGLSVLVIPAEKCRDPRVIMRSRALVLGCPAYFSLPPWQMVRFFDETLYRIYRARVQLTDHVVTAFATTESCLDVLQNVLRSTRGNAVDGAVITPRRTSEEERDARVKELADRIAAGL